MNSLSLNAYAKINLSLEVVERKPDGYHRIISVMQQIDLCDEIQLDVLGTSNLTLGNKINFQSDSNNIPTDDNNLVMKAANFMEETFCPTQNNKLNIRLKKNIPVAAGLAGGSTDAAATMLALAKLWNVDISLKDLIEMGKHIGADVPFCIMGNAKNNIDLGFADNELASSSALAEDIGDKLTPCRGLKGYVLLIKPDIGISTKSIYVKVAEKDYVDEVEYKNELCIQNQDNIRQNMHNVLETASLKEYPILVYTKNKMQESLSADIVLMSGSGPTLYGYYPEKKQAENDYMKAMDIFGNRSDNAYFLHLAKLQ